MKLIKIEIEDDTLLKITCKPSLFKSYLKEIDKITEDMRAKDLRYKYFGLSFDKNKNIVLAFRLLDADKDIKPYTKFNKVVEEC